MSAARTIGANRDRLTLKQSWREYSICSRYTFGYSYTAYLWLSRFMATYLPWQNGMRTIFTALHYVFADSKM